LMTRLDTSTRAGEVSWPVWQFKIISLLARTESDHDDKN
jgi:hypothetical protein